MTNFAQINLTIGFEKRPVIATSETPYLEKYINTWNIDKVFSSDDVDSAVRDVALHISREFRTPVPHKFEILLRAGRGK